MRISVADDGDAQANGTVGIRESSRGGSGKFVDFKPNDAVATCNDVGLVELSFKATDQAGFELIIFVRPHIVIEETGQYPVDVVIVNSDGTVLSPDGTRLIVVVEGPDIR